MWVQALEKKVKEMTREEKDKMRLKRVKALIKKVGKLDTYCAD